ncbi:hypothetical protein [Streptomyces sp. NPDC058086]
MGCALYAESADLTIAKVAKGALPYFGELDEINRPAVNRPTRR